MTNRITEDVSDPITAGELRANGVAIPEEIPDCGWVPKSSIIIMGLDNAKIENNVITMDLRWIFPVPFKWVEATVELNKPSNDSLTRSL